MSIYSVPKHLSYTIYSINFAVNVFFLLHPVSALYPLRPVIACYTAVKFNTTPANHCIHNT